MTARRLSSGAVFALLVFGAATWTSPERRDPWQDRDWEVFESKVRWAVQGGLDTLPLARTMAEIGRSFVGTPYAPRTLEVEGPERVVVNFRAFDCVTFVENVFALARFVRSWGVGGLADRSGAETRYETLLSEVRYRGGRVDGYPSRLHYFSEWISDNERRGLVVDLGRGLGGVHDDEAIDFMTTHPAAYTQLSDPANVSRVRRAEEWLSARGRWYVPEGQINDASDRIRDGDIIAATSSVEGLDVAHTGLALWVDGSLRLLHAPLVGDSVQISELPLADRILGIAGQDGVMVARAIAR